MNVKSAKILIIIVGLVLSITGFYTSFLTTNQNKTEIIDPLDEITFPLELNDADEVKGNLIILEGSQGIRIYIKEPNGELIYDGGAVYTSLDFVLNSQTKGTYRLSLINLNSEQQQKIQLSLLCNQFSRLTSFLVVFIGILLTFVGIVMMFL